LGIQAARGLPATRIELSDTSRTSSQTPAAVPANTVLDHSLLLSSVDGDMDLLGRISELILNSCPSFISEIRKAIEGADRNALARAAHTFKGSGGYFLTNLARESLIELELIAQGSDLNGAAERLAAIEMEVERVKPELSILAGNARRHDE